MQDCMICQKHKNILDFTGEVILEKGGWVLTHFPFIDGQKATKGYLLIETRRHIENLTDMNAQEAAALGELICEGSQLLKFRMNAEHVYVFRINDKVPHLHFHLVPRYPNTPKEFWGFKISEWSGTPKISLDEIQEVSKFLKSST